MNYQTRIHTVGQLTFLDKKPYRTYAGVALPILRAKNLAAYDRITSIYALNLQNERVHKHIDFDGLDEGLVEILHQPWFFTNSDDRYCVIATGILNKNIVKMVGFPDIDFAKDQNGGSVAFVSTNLRDRLLNPVYKLKRSSFRIAKLVVPNRYDQHIKWVTTNKSFIYIGFNPSEVNTIVACAAFDASIDPATILFRVTLEDGRIVELRPTIVSLVRCNV